MIPILYDGWPLSYSPNSPGALHLLTLLESITGEIEPILALPAAPPEWLPGKIRTQVIGVGNTPSGRLVWEQGRLPGLARQIGANLIHITSQSPALLAPVRSLVSPAGFGFFQNEGVEGHAGSNRDVWEPGEPEGLAERLRRSLSRGAQERVLALLWPEDLPYFGSKVEPHHIKKLPPVVHPAFSSNPEQGQAEPHPDLPDTYLIYPGPYNRYSIQNLLQAWSWVAGPLGDSCLLTLVGAPEDRLKPLDSLLQTSGLADSIQVLPSMSPAELANLYRGCKGLFHPGPLSVWEGPLRHALVCSRAIVATRSPLAEALLGPAAYLLPDMDFRGMGAALITIVLEEEVEERLSQSARERSAKWDLELFREVLARTYQELANTG